MNVGLGATIEKGSQYFIDIPHDKVVSVPPGTYTYTRSFTIPSEVPSGSYQVDWGIWSGAPGSTTLYKMEARGDYLNITMVEWKKTYGGIKYDGGFQMTGRKTSDNGYIAVGETKSYGSGGSDIYVIKTDPSGNQLWEKWYGGSKDDKGFSIWQITDGGFIIAGCTNSFGKGSWDVYLLRIDNAGKLIWSKTYGGSGSDLGLCVQQTLDGGFIISGQTNSYGFGSYDFYVLKTDNLGIQQWEHTYGGSNDEVGYSIDQTNDGGYIITGYKTVSGNEQVYLVRINSTGNLKWEKTYGGNNNDGGIAVQQTNDSGYIIAGWSASSGTYDMYLIKTNDQGDLLWQKTYGGNGKDVAWSVDQSPDGGYIVVGETNSYGSGGYDIYVVRVNSSGDIVWEKTFGGPADEKGCYIEATNDQELFITGWTYSYGAGDCDFYLVRSKLE